MSTIDILKKMTLEQRIHFLLYVCGYSSEDARDYALEFETTQDPG